ncbi:P-type conjugative transfer protein TrbL [Sphingosinicellaceae bacterium]|nr:P-type conjugative transfer protein TrbL [Sphingosinicellaceae bacterium]
MNNTGVIDQFLDVFTRYIDSGFGLLRPEMAYLATTLIVIDVTLAALFWAWGEGDDILARLVKKTLFVGAFAYLIGNWNTLARIVFESFAGLGLKASGTSLTLADFLRPGRIAQVGIDAGRPILDSISGLMGYVSFFENFIQIIVLLVAWGIVILSFFILAIQLFVALIEFKLTTLAGFVLVPFGLWGKTAFMAERVLGNVISSGIKVLVLAVIVGIGSTLFAQFTAGFGGGAAGAQPTIEDALGIVLAALSLLALGIFGPGIANGLVAGGPQLGAGAAVGTGLAAGGAAFATVGAARLAGGVAAGAAGGIARGGAYAAGAATAGYRGGSAGSSGIGAVTGGAGGVARAGATAVVSPLRRAAASITSSFDAGGRGAETGFAPQGAGAATSPAGGASTANGTPPAWAQNMRRSQTVSHGVGLATHAIRAGDGSGSGSSVSVAEKE